MGIGMAPKKKAEFSPARFLASTGKGRTVASYEDGAIVFAQGDSADSLFYIRTGKVKITVVSNAGKEAVIALLGAGDFFGEGCLAGQKIRSSSVTALSPCAILRMERAAVVEVLRRETAFSELLLSYMLTRTMRIEEDLVDQLFNSCEKRLARALLLLANFGPEGEPKAVARISQETLAEMIGATRSRVSFFMNKFRRQGFIHYNGVIEVHSSLLNVVTHD
jgi:CRP/FNR family cyclic AMP-dependent transcriptional regulator